MHRTWTRRTMGCALVLVLGCAETDKSLGDVSRESRVSDGDSGSGGKTSQVDGAPSAGDASSSLGGASGTTGGASTAAGGASTAAGGASTAAGGAGAVDGGAEPPDCHLRCPATEVATAPLLTWGLGGGAVDKNDVSRMRPCSTLYEHYRVNVVTTEPMLMCSAELPNCNPNQSPIPSWTDVVNGFAADDVQAAFAGSPSVFGLNPRPVDGVVFFISQGDADIYLGDPCNAGQDGCTPIPPGIEALRKMLEQVDSQELARGECKTVFGQ